MSLPVGLGYSLGLFPFSLGKPPRFTESRKPPKAADDSPDDAKACPRDRLCAFFHRRAERRRPPPDGGGIFFVVFGVGGRRQMGIENSPS